jgi:hypothetical protein
MVNETVEDATESTAVADKGTESTESTESIVADLENYAEEVPVGYWDSLMQNISTWEKVSEEDSVVSEFDSFD